MKKGFTLIELLAVIVILAIIALIATPIVLNIINDTKKSATIRGAEFYIDALENAIMLENMKTGGTFNPNVCQVTNKVISCDGKELTLKVDGEVPTSGSITFDGGKVTNVNLTYQGGSVTQNNKGELVFGDINIPEPKSFAEDSWDTIAANVRAGNLSKYNVGDTKQITLTSTDTDIAGTYTVRIANTSTPEECKTEGFSQTACGFVIEFADVISEHSMNSTNTSIGGWEASAMRTYVNNDILNSFPEELKDNIIDTYVVSGHESDKTKNYKTTDKLYLLSTKEIWQWEGDDMPVCFDLGTGETRQLDYYKQKGVTYANYSFAIKKYHGSNHVWWLRSACYNWTDPDATKYFFNVDVDGYWGYCDAVTYNSQGVAVAFRVG